MWPPTLKGTRVLRLKDLCKKRAYTPQAFGNGYHAMPRVDALKPTLWCLAAVTSIYGIAAAWEVLHDVKDVERNDRMRALNSDGVRMENIERIKSAVRIKSVVLEEPLGADCLDPTRFSSLWQSMSGPSKMMVSVAGLNTGIFGLSAAIPAFKRHLLHTPAAGLHKNYTMLTSMFGHSGLVHLGLNMYVLFNFGTPVARTRTFEGSGSHLTAFYLSSGIMASLVSHLTSIWPSPRFRMSAGLGASGAIYAMLGAFALSYPDAGIGIILIPLSLPASQALVGIAAFEAYGLLKGFRSLPFGHGAHLGGLMAGCAYVYFDGKKYLWKPARRITFKALRRLGMC